MLRRQALLVALALLAIAGPARLDAQHLTPESAELLYRWAKAVNRHVPGYPDDAVAEVARLTYGERQRLSPSHALFMRKLRDEIVPAHNDVERDVLEFARGMRVEPGMSAFLKRAAVLHADAVVFGSRFPPPFDDTPAGPPDDNMPPLLINDRITLTRDGQVVGNARVSWHLPFARSLLGVLLRDRRSRGDTEFAGDWYHAVAAYLFSKGMYGDANRHLEQAARALPDDARMLFDRGSYAETFGLPIYQAVDDPRVPSEDKTNGEAERLYRRALEADPSYVEARVRLARLLDQRGRHDEAAEEIEKALAARPSDVTGFYARLVAGRIATSRGRYDEALQRYREASAGYPAAQSAMLGASHAALMLADVPAAMKPLAQLDREAVHGADPWQDYRLGAGRDATALLAALWEGAAQWR